MTLAEILSNETLRQHEFPVTRHSAFLAHAAVSPLPHRVSEAIRDYCLTAVTGDQEAVAPAGIFAQTRQLAAQMLKATPEEIALVGPTSLGLSLVANGLSFPAGSNVLLYFDDYPSNVYPWQTFAQRGAEVRHLRVPALGQIRVADVLEQIDANTRLVALASCHFVTGWRLELDALGQALHERGILFCVDGIQTLGAFPTPVTHVDFLAADAHKWLLGPNAAGILYVRRDQQARLTPSVYGWANLQCPNFVAQADPAYQPDARRYEAGTANLLGLIGLRAALEMLLEVGIEAITAELLRKRALLIPALQAKGYTVWHADAPAANAGAIITFDRDGEDMAALHQRLRQAGVVASLRGDRSGRQHVRLSPHFYNSDAELERVLATV